MWDLQRWSHFYDNDILNICGIRRPRKSQLRAILKWHYKQLAMTYLVEISSLYYHYFTNYVYSGVLTKCHLPDITPLPASLFSTPVGLSWYHASIAPLPVNLFSTLTGLLAFIELPVVRFLLIIDPLPMGLFNTPAGLPCIMILNIWKTIGTRAYLILLNT